MEGSPIEWVETTPCDAPNLEACALVAGYDGDSSPLWVIRASHDGDLVPGKLAVKRHVAYIPWGGKEVTVYKIEVCCARPERVHWVGASDGDVPPGAVGGGATRDCETLYVGRAHEKDSLTPGKIQPSQKVLYIPYGGLEVAHRRYEVLCTL